MCSIVTLQLTELLIYPCISDTTPPETVIVTTTTYNSRNSPSTLNPHTHTEPHSKLPDSGCTNLPFAARSIASAFLLRPTYRLTFSSAFIPIPRLSIECIHSSSRSPFPGAYALSGTLLVRRMHRILFGRCLLGILHRLHALRRSKLV